MSAKWEKKGTNDGVLTFEIAEDEIKKALDQAFNKVKKNLTAPGFRKGKIPRQIFNKMYGEESLYEDAVNIALPAAYEKALEETKVEPVAQPKIDIESMEKGKPWVMTAEITVKPEVKLGQYKELEVTKQPRRVTIKDVEKNLEQKQNMQAELVLKEDAPAENGDTVVIDFLGKVDDVPFDGGQAENYSLELGSGSFIPGFEDQLVGKKAGDNVAVKVTFPEDYQAEDLQGKEAVFDVTVHEVKGKELPALDDEFAKDIDDEVETLDELKEKIREQLKESKKVAAENAIEEEAIEKAVNNAEIIDLPEVMVHDEVHRQMDMFLNDMSRQGISPELYYQITGTTENDLHVQMEKDAEMRTKTNLVLEAIVEAENFKATDEEIQNEVKDLADQYGMDEVSVRAALTDDMLAHDINMKKAMNLITDTAVEK